MKSKSPMPAGCPLASARRSLRLNLCGLVLAVASSGLAENWPSWRGPRGDGTSLETGVPVKWSATENVIWKTELPGIGHAAPIVWGDRVFTVTALPESLERVLLCLDRKTGKILWQKTVLTSPLEKKHRENSYASGTPATDGQKVFVAFLDDTSIVVAAYDFTGKPLWSVKPGTFASQWGFASSPQLFEDKLIIDCDSKDENFLAALSIADGHTLWKTKRPNPSQSYATPLIRKMAGRDQIIQPGGNSVSSYDPKDGSCLWTVDGKFSDYLASPAYSEKAGLVLASSSWPGRILVAVRPGGSGNVTTTQVAWSTEEGAPYVPAPVAAGGYFLTSAMDKAVCFEAATGKVLWKQEIGLCHASPVVANGAVYFLNDEGVMNVVKPGPAFELISRNELGEKTYAQPAISQGQVFIRGFTHLYCIGAAAK
ncbi:MAG: PQQ-binding-like beta-propeller repeat protein [bacterium]